MKKIVLILGMLLIAMLMSCERLSECKICTIYETIMSQEEFEQLEQGMPLAFASVMSGIDITQSTSTVSIADSITSFIACDECLLAILLDNQHIVEEKQDSLIFYIKTSIICE